MSENKNAISHSMLGAYLSRGYQNTHNKRLDNFLKTGGHLASTPLGALIHTMIMKSLQRKATQEDKANRSRQSDLLDEYRESKINEKTMLQNLEAELREKAEERKNQHNKESEKEKRAWEEEQTIKKHQHERALAEQKLREKLDAETRGNKRNEDNEKIKNEVNQKNKVAEEKRNFIVKNFGNPIEAIEYWKNPEAFEGKLENYDPRGIVSRTLGLIHGTAFTNENKLRIKK